MTSKFVREERYIVFKVSDLGNSFKGDEVRRLAREYAEHRQRLHKEPLECVVVEKSWPEYELAWRAIEARVTGAQPMPSAPIDSIGRLLTQAMDVAVANGANSVSMPDELVEVAAWLSGVQPAPSVPTGFVWPECPKRRQSHVLFDDGYEEGWAACVATVKAMLAAAPKPEGVWL